MGTITDSAGNEVSVDELFGTEIIRCRNWELAPDLCGATCGVEVPAIALRSAAWINLVLDSNPEWFVMLRSCHEHGRHADPYCSLACFELFHAQHEHPHDP